jgi:hypothetical protein
MSNAKLVLLSYGQCVHVGNAAAVAGGGILPAPIRRWGPNEWDAQFAGHDRLAIVPTSWGDGRDVTSEIPAILGALREYDNEDEISETISAINAAFAA